MKLIAILAIVSTLYGSSFSRRLDRNENSMDSLYEPSSYRHSMDRMVATEKVDVEMGDADFSSVMTEVRDKLESATDQAMIHLTSVLMIKDTSNVSDGLRAKISEFKESLVDNFERDLTQVVKEFKNGRSVQGPLSDEERYAFTDILKNTWEQTLTADLEAFQQKSLPRWVNSVRKVWKGIEKKVLDKIDQFKKFVHKTSPRSSDTCALPSALLVGSETISVASQSMKKYSMQRMDKTGSEIVGKIAIFILAIVGVITLAVGAPYFFFLLGLFWLVDTISDLIFGHQV